MSKKVKKQNKIYTDRLTELRSLMKKERLDLVLVYSSWNDYLFGVFLNGIKPLQYQYFYITAENSGYLVPDYILEPYRLDINPDSKGFVEAKLPHVLKEFSAHAKRIGIIGPAPAKHLKRIKSEIVFLEEQISYLMSAKSKEEIKSIERAKAASAKVMSMLSRKIKPGARLDLLAKEAEAMLLKETDSLAFPIIVYSDDSKKSILSSFGFPAKVAKKDVIMVDIGAEKNGLMSDLNRMFFVGKTVLKKQYELLIKAHRNAVKKIKNGLLLSKIPHIYQQEFDKIGIGHLPFNKEDMGRSIGFGLNELPRIGENLDTRKRIKANMAITIILKVRLENKVVEMQDTLTFNAKKI